MQDPEESEAQESEGGNASDHGVSPVISSPTVTSSIDASGNLSMSIGGSDFSVDVAPPPEQSTTPSEEESFSFESSGPILVGGSVVETYSWTSNSSGITYSSNVVFDSSGTWSTGPNQSNPNSSNVWVQTSDGGWVSGPIPTSSPASQEEEDES
jgi:hypothetical protein